MTTSARVRRRIQTGRIAVRFVAEGNEGIGQLKNISKAGLFIRAEDSPRKDCPLAIQFESPSGSLVNLRGQVRWRTQDLVNPEVPAAGFGVRLHEPPKPYREFFLWLTEQTEEKEDGEP